jgi:hypothetical protein
MAPITTELHWVEHNIAANRGRDKLLGLTKLGWLACAVNAIAAESGVAVSVQEYNVAVVEAHRKFRRGRGRR